MTMRHDIPCYTRTRLGETPHAYLIDGATALPISRIAAEGPKPFGRSRGFPKNLARIDELAATIAKVDAIDSRIPRFAAPGAVLEREDALGVEC